jgi:hypothetical protein
MAARRQIWDTLELTRETPEGTKYYKGSKGLYVFLFTENGNGGRAGRVILNRKYLTGLFRSRYDKTGILLGDAAAENKFLIFEKEGPEKIVIKCTRAKRKKVL